MSVSARDQAAAFIDTYLYAHARDVVLEMKRWYRAPLRHGPCYLGIEALGELRRLCLSEARRIENEVVERVSKWCSHPVGSLMAAQGAPPAACAAIVALPPERVFDTRTPLARYVTILTEDPVLGAVWDALFHQAAFGATSTWPEWARKILDSELQRSSGNRIGARARAARTVSRIMVFNAWLVWTTYAVKSGRVTKRDLEPHINEMLAMKGRPEPRETFVRRDAVADPRLASAIDEASVDTLVRYVLGK